MRAIRLRSVALVAALVASVVGAVAVQPASAATLTVTSAADSGAGTLRDRVNGAVSGDVITFSSALNGVPITLTSTGITVNTNLTIRGNGPASTIIRRAAGPPFFTVLNVAPAVTATIDLVTVTGGEVVGDGGGIRNLGILTLTRSTVTGNRATRGGGIYNGGGGLTVTNTEISDNRAVADGGQAEGGGIFSEVGQPVVLTNVFVSGNDATGLVAIGAGIRSLSPLTVTDSAVNGNDATANHADGAAIGGGIAAGDIGSAHIDVSVVNSTIVFNSATLIPAGGTGESSAGGIYLEDTSATLDRLEVSENTALGPNPASGGGIVTFFTTMTLTNSTIAANATSNVPGSSGGGLFAPTGTVSLLNSTIASNTSPGAAILNADAQLTEKLTIVNNPGSGQNCVGVIIDAGGNIWFGGTQGTCPGPNANPNLGPLQNNGGVSRTMALGGPNGIDYGGSPPTCPAADQRGFPRVGTCDIGAFEANSTVVDNTPPTCALLGVILANPKQQNVQVSDAARGLQAITNISATNAVVAVPWFLRGTKLPFVVTATKVNQASGSSWRFSASDQAANTRLCS